MDPDTRPILLLRLLLVFVFLFAGLYKVNAEGTRELRPLPTDAGFMQIWDPSLQPTRTFMTYAADSNRRLYINICRPGERMYFGFRTSTVTQVTFFRVRDPLGNIVFGPVQIPTAAGPGLIDTYAQAVAGPSALVPGGYNALTYDPTMTGNYSIEFNPTNANTTTIGARRFDLFDITVATIATNTIRRGRLWAKAWDLTLGSFTARYNARMFMYAPDGVVTELDFNGIQPFGFIISANGRGCTNTGNTTNDRRSRGGNFTYPDYPIFLNNPDSTCFPTGVLGDITAPPSISGCNPANRCINVFVNKAGTVDIILELNGIPGYQENSADVIINAQVDSGANCVPWNSRNGLGVLITPGTVIPITVDYYNGLTHLPLFDVENHQFGYRVFLTRPLGPQPRLYWDDTLIAGGTRNPFIGCNNPGGCHNWSGNIAPNGITPRSNWGDVRSINTWWFASVRSSNASVPNFITLVDANIFNPPLAPNDTVICTSSATIPLNGSVTIGATTGRWSSATTGGVFSPNDSSLTATYQFSPTDIANGFARIVLTSTNTGGCPPQSDTMRVTLAPQPVSNAGPGDTVCFNNPNVQLSGSFTGGSRAYWAGGTGSFLPDSSAANAIFVPGQADINAGGVYVRYITRGIAPCLAPDIDSVFIDIIDPIAVVAGTDISACKSNPQIQLNGQVTVTGAPGSIAVGGRWSGGLGTYTPNDSTLNAIYTPTAAEVASGNLRLILTSIGNGFCIPERDTVNVTFTDPPSVNAGVDAIVCDFQDTLNLSAIVSPGFTGAWSGGVSGSFFPNNTLPNAQYVISVQDSINGFITLVYTTNAGNGCVAVRDTVVYAITAAPRPEAGPSVNVCETNATVNLNGTVSLGGSAFWSSLGDGTFIPSPNVLNATYEPGPNDIASTIIFLYLTTTGSACTPLTDSVQVIIGNAPRADAGPNQTVCKNNPLVSLNGSSLSGTTASRLWSGGNGTFNPNPPNQFAATYTPTASELAAGSVKLYFRVNTVTCNGLNDSLTITFTDPPNVNAGPAIIDVCTNAPTATLNGSVSGGIGGSWSNGTGTFNPSADSLSTQYTASATEVSAGTVTLVLTSSTVGNNCLPVSDSIRIRIVPGPDANAGPDQTLCKNNAVVSLNGVATNAGGGRWLGGAGTFTPSRNVLSPTYTPDSNEINAGFVNLVLRTTGNGFCTPDFDTVRINFSNGPTINVNSPSQVCIDNPNVSLSASFTIAGGVTWTGNGGLFVPSADSANVTYLPTLAELNAGNFTLSVSTRQNGSCLAGSTSRNIQVLNRPVANAGPNQTVCGGVANVSLNGTVTGATGGTWKTSGTGTFSPNVNTLNATYSPSTADVNSGFVVLMLTSTGNGLCNADSSTMVISFTANPSINAGPDKVVCSNDFPAQLQGSGSAATWFGGNGTFVPNSSTLNATYQPSPGEILNGFVRLRLITNPNPNCIQVADTVILTLRSGPTVNAGTDQTVCGDRDSIQLNAIVNNAPFSAWSSLGTGNFSNPNATNSFYRFSATDKLNGFVNLVLTVPAGNGCSDVTDTMRVTITPTVQANAGADQELCEDIPGITLNGSVIVATGGSWSSPGAGTFSPSNTSLTATYTPTAAERLAQRVVLVLSTTGNGTCQVSRDTVVFDLADAPTVDAGTNQTLCSANPQTFLSGSVTVALGGQWSTGGSGVFSPNNNALSGSYIPSLADIDSGSVKLFLSSIGNGVCATKTDSLTITLLPLPIANPGLGDTVCTDVDTISLSGLVQNATGGRWSSSGSGQFVPNNNTLNAAYLPSNADRQAQFVSLRLTTTGVGICPADSNAISIRFTDEPTLNVGLDVEICETNTSLALNAVFTQAGGILWRTNGTGTFSPDSLNPNAIYLLSAADRARDSLFVWALTRNSPNCAPAVDTMKVRIQRAPIVNAGANITICASNPGVSLSGSVANAGGGVWSSTGGGNFFPNAFDLNATYVPTANERQSGIATLILTSTANGPCTPPPSDTVLINVTPIPTVDLGGNKEVCSDTNAIPLTALVSVASSGLWRSSGSGVFAPADTGFFTTYIPSALDIASGLVRITFFTTGNGLCDTVSQFIDVSIKRAPIVNAGVDQTICRTTSSLSLNGSVTNATGGVWTALGTGGFDPFNTTLNGDYFPSPADRNAGQVRLVLRSDGTGICKTRRDTMLVIIRQIPTLDIGRDTSICRTSGGVRLNALYTNAGGVQWAVVGTGNLFPNNVSDTVNFVPAPADTLVRIRATTTLNGVCSAVFDSLLVRIANLPTVSAGPAKEMCTNGESADLTGSFSNAVRIRWSTNGTGVISDTSSAIMFYQPSTFDRTQNSILFTLTAITDGVCPNISQTTTLNLTKAPTVNTGFDFEVCKSLDSININAVVSNTTGGVWSTLGSGTFIPNDTARSVFYKPVTADTSAGLVRLSYQTQGLGSCLPSTDTVVVTFSSALAINAGPPIDTICSSNLPAQLNGAGTAGTWSGGAGTFSPSATVLNATYQPTPAEITAGQVRLRLTSPASGACPSVVDSVLLRFVLGPTVNLGLDRTICADTTGISIAPSVTNANGFTWTTTGSGSFAPGNTVANVTYIPSQDDIADSIVILSLTVGSSFGCTPASDQLNLFINPAPTLFAGFDVTVCRDVDSVLFTATATRASGASWRTAAGVNLPNNGPNAFSIWYRPTPANIAAGFVNLIATTTGVGICKPVSDTVRLTLTPTVTKTIGPLQNICATASTVNLSATFTVAQGIQWSTTGTGLFSISSFINNPTYEFSALDKTRDSLIFRMITTGNGTCRPALDSTVVRIRRLPTVSTTNFNDICKSTVSIQLNSNFTNAGGVKWISSGTGTFSNPNIPNPLYFPSQADYDANAVSLMVITTGNGACDSAFAISTILFNNQPVAQVNAGFDVEICKDASLVPLSGLILNAGGGTWSSSGTGSFLPTVNSLNGFYQPSTTDKAQDSVYIRLTSASTNVCAPVTDSITVTFTPTPTVNAGPDDTICADQPNVQLSGLITVATGGIWTSSGTGTFVPNAFDRNAIYQLSAQDIANGFVGLTLTTDGNGTCNSVSDGLVITILGAPEITTDSLRLICSDVDSIPISAQISRASGLIWTSTGTGIFLPSVTSTNAHYYPSAADKSAGSVVITATTSGNGLCQAVTANQLIQFILAPVVNAGPDQTICEDAVSINLSGTVDQGIGTIWTTNGNGTFLPGEDSLTTSYQITLADRTRNSITFTLSTLPGQCKTQTDLVTYTLQRLPVVSTGPSDLCLQDGAYQLNGSISNSPGGLWTTTGSGQFSTSNSILDPLYIPSAGDFSLRKIKFTLTSIASGSCPASSAEMEVDIVPPPFADAGLDQIVCRGDDVLLASFRTNNVSYRWKTVTGFVIGQGPLVTIRANNDTAFVVEAIDNLGCSSQDTVGIRVIDAPSFTLDPHFCFDTSVVINSFPINIPPVAGVFQWFRNDTIVFGANNSTYKLEKPGEHRILYYFSSCSNEAFTDVTLPPVIRGEDKTVCNGDTVSLQVNPIIGATYLWTTNNLFIINSDFQFDTIANNDPSIDQVFAVTVTDQLGCTGTDTLVLKTTIRPIIDARDTSGCQGLGLPVTVVPLNRDSLNTAGVYTWFRDNLLIESERDSVLNATEPGIYRVRYSVGDCFASDTFSLVFNPLPQLILPDKLKYCKDDEDSLAVTVPGFSRYLWSGVGAEPGDTLSTFYATDSGFYTVTVFNQFNCPATDSLFVEDLCNPRVFLPNGFTPNGDGKDDLFRVFGNYFKDFSITIFNRWGEAIFHATEITEGWDGNYKGEPMPIGTYPYIVVYSGLDAEFSGPFKKQGSVTLIR